MDLTLRQPDPERHRRRLRLLAEIASAKTIRTRLRSPQQTREERIRELIIARRRPTA